MALSSRSTIILAVFSTGLSLSTPAVAAGTPTVRHSYQHGLYAQAHFSDADACTTARANAVTALTKAGATSISAGPCHASDMTAGGAKTNAYLYDVSYEATAPLWSTDGEIASTAGTHSFRTTYDSASQTDAATHLAGDTAQIKKLSGSLITASPGVHKDARTGHYTYEIDYTSRIPASAAHVEISEQPGVVTAQTPHLFQHGLYVQGHYSDANACATAATSAASTLTSAGADDVTAGACHPIDILNGTTKLSGYLVDITYRATKAQWSNDSDLGATPPATAGNHSFRDQYASSTQADATLHFNTDTAKVKSLSGGSVTYSTGVKLNAATGHYQYEIDYDSRVPAYANHVEISESPGVTSPSLGVKTPIPTGTTTTASNDGVTKPGGGSMGWNQGTGSTPPKATAPSNGTVTGTGTKSTGSGTVTSQNGTTVGVQGIDISGNTTTNDWAGWKKSGVKFIYTKASEGNYYTNPQFATQYNGAYANGIIRGAYHFANPAASTGADQADYFIAHGGGWSADGKTLPGVIDMEWDPYGDMCYGLTQTQMVTWTRSFINEYRAKTGVDPMIYTASIWWNRCVGSADFSSIPLWIAQYNTKLGALPTGWGSAKQLVWQNAALDDKGYDTDIFNGTLAQLSNFAGVGRRQ